MNLDVGKMVKLSVLSALSVALMMLVRFPIIPAAPFLEYEPGDVPALIGAFLYGPSAGIIITAVVSIVQAATVSAASGWVGAAMHMVATGTMVLVAGTIYKKIHTRKGAMIALAAGCLSMTLVMIPLNLIVTPLFLNTPVEVVKGMLLPAIIPFNLIKSVANAALTAFVYKSVGRILRAQVGTASNKTMEA